MLTVCLTSWRRHNQVHEIIEQLTRQSCEPRIFVWNNDKTYLFKDDRAHVVINSSENFGGRHIVASMQMAGTPYVAKMDDDLHLADDDVLADALKILATCSHSTTMIGPYGVKIHEGGTYATGNHVAIPKGHGQYSNGVPEPHNVRVDVLKGRLIIANLEAALLGSCAYTERHEDLPLCFAASGTTRKHHLAASCFFDHVKECSRVPDFPADTHGMCFEEGHLDSRNEACAKWIATCVAAEKVKER